MWVLSWKTYKISKLATFVSVVGALVRYAGVLCFFESLIPAGIICVAIGIGLHFGAEQTAFSALKKSFAKNGIEERIRNGDVSLAMNIIQKNSKKKMLDYLSSLNENVAYQISQLQIGSAKK